MQSLSFQVISIHAPTRGATPRGVRIAGKKSFQSTSHTGSDHYQQYRHGWFYRFQSTLPHGERLSADDLLKDVQKFQSTLPHGERRSTEVAILMTPRFKSTLPHGERQIFFQIHCRLVCIAIHAPTRGATAVRWICTTIHTFQSTLPHGERQILSV